MTSPLPASNTIHADAATSSGAVKPRAATTSQSAMRGPPAGVAGTGSGSGVGDPGAGTSEESTAGGGVVRYAQSRVSRRPGAGPTVSSSFDSSSGAESSGAEVPSGSGAPGAAGAAGAAGSDVGAATAGCPAVNGAAASIRVAAMASAVPRDAGPAARRGFVVSIARSR